MDLGFPRLRAWARELTTAARRALDVLRHAPGARATPTREPAVDRLHHVGLVVRDLDEALACYRRLGFELPAPSCGAVACEDGGPPEPFGAANVHATFGRDFVELVARIDGPAPRDAILVPVQVPREHVDRFRELVARSTDTLAWCLERFEGLHILALHAPDVDGVAARLSGQGVGHGGVHAAERRLETDAGAQMVPIRVLELDGPQTGVGRVPEGRVAIVTDAMADAERRVDHPNGALALVEAVLCVADAELPATARRYEAYLGRAARDEGGARVLDLAGSRIVLVASSALDALLPGERAPALPAFVAYAVTVRDVDDTRRLLAARGLPLRTTAAGELFVPAEAALGAAVIFRPA